MNARKLSPEQRRILLLSSMPAYAHAYHVDFEFTFIGPVDRNRLDQALRVVVGAHASLRNHVRTDRAGDVVAVPADDYSSTWLQHVTLTGTDGVSTHRDSHLDTRFELTSGIPIRATIGHAATKTYLWLTIHHAFIDMWSYELVVASLIEAYRTGRAAPSAQAYGPDSSRRGDDVAYWLNRLQGAPELSSIFSRRLADRPPTGDGETIRREIGTALEGRLRGAGRTMRVTPNVIALTAHIRTAMEVSEQRDLIVGLPVANRLPAEMQTVGFFTNTVPFRIIAPGGQPANVTVEQVRNEMAEGLRHQRGSFDDIVRLHNPQALRTSQPLFQTTFQWYRFRDRFELTDVVDVRVDLLPRRTSQFDLSVDVEDRQGSLRLNAEYATDVGDEAVVEAFLDRSIDTIDSLVTPVRRHRSPVQQDRPRADSVEQWARTHPDRPAAILGSRTLSYDDLHHLTEASVAELLRAGLRPGLACAVLLPLSSEQLVLMLAIWRIGAVYVPLDPSWPEQRRTAVLARVRPAVVVHADTQDSRSTSSADTQSVVLEPRAETLPSGSRRYSDTHYLLHTSGSTGLPKAVTVSASALQIRIEVLARRYGLGPNDRCLLLASPHFDVSLEEALTAWLAGAAVVVRAGEDHRAAHELAAFLDSSTVSVLNCPSGLWHELVDHLHATGRRWPTACRLTIIGSEPVDRERARNWWDISSSQQTLLAAYGTTESCITSVVGTVRPWWTDTAGPLPIGVPLDGVSADVVADDGSLVAPNETGQLRLTSISTASGYLDDETATSAVFSLTSDGRIAYLTGDLVRWHQGVLEYVGRIDRESKVSGERVDLRALENVAARVPGVVAARASTIQVSGRIRTALAVSWEPTREEEDRRVRTWAEVHDHPDLNRPSADPRQDFSGWLSSFTGSPIPRHDMQHWLKGTVSRIRSLGPANVLEIGCGTGLLLHQLLPHVASYDATDIAAGALGQIEHSHGRVGSGQGALRLFKAPAHEWAWHDGRRYDTIILNSVAQYFPSRRYLVEVVQNAIARLAPEGHLFIGDLRDLSLASRFYRALADASDERRDTTKSWTDLRDHESELLVHPALFTVLEESLRYFDYVVMPKQHHGDNELTRYRYDVIIRNRQNPKIERTAPSQPAYHTSAGASRDEHQLVADAVSRSAPVLITDVRDDRLPDHEFDDALRLDPARVGTIAERAGLTLHLRRPPQSPPGHLELRLAPSHLVGNPIDGWPAAQPAPGVLPERLVNDPMAQELSTDRLRRLRRTLAETLPRSHQPAEITTEGFGDGQPSPQPSPAREITRSSTPDVDDLVGRAWRSIIPGALTEDTNFFVAGGDSLLLIRLLAKLSEAGTDVSLSDALTDPTPAGLRRAAAAARPHVLATPSPGLVRDAPLLPMQAWMLNREPADPNQYSQPLVIELPSFSESQVRAALTAALDRLSYLRTVFRRGSDGWRQYRPDTVPTLPWMMLDDEADEAEIVQRCASAIDLASGSTVSAGWKPSTLAPGGRLYIVAHHFVVDEVTWDMLLEALDAALVGESPPAGSHVEHTEQTFVWARRSEESDEASPPVSTIPAVAAVDCFASRTTEPPGRVRDRRHRTLKLPSSDEPVLDSATQEAAALALVASALGLVGGVASVIVDVESHGRLASVDSSQPPLSAGWFTTVAPIAVDLRADDLEQHVRERLGAGRQNSGYTRNSRPEHSVLGLRAPSAGFNFVRSAPAPSLTRSRGLIIERTSRLLEHPDSPLAYTIEVNVRTSGTKQYADLAYDSSRLSTKLIDEVCRHLQARPRDPQDRPFTPSEEPALVGVLAHQNLMLARHQLNGLDDENINQSVTEISGPLDQSTLTRAWQCVVDRHDGLRSRYRSRSDGTYGQHFPDLTVSIPLRELDAGANPDLVTQELARDERLKLNDLSSACLALAVLKVKPGLHRMIWTDHHVLLDGWSTTLVLQDLMHAYRWLSTPATLRLERPFDRSAPSLADFARDVSPSTHVARSATTGASRRVPAGKHQGRFQTLRQTSEALTGDLHRLSRASSTSSATVILGLWSIIGAGLDGSLGSRPTTIGFSSSERHLAYDGVDRLVGSLATIRPLDVTVSSTKSFADVIKYVRDAQIALLAGSAQPADEVEGFLAPTAVVVQTHAAHELDLRAGPVRVTEFSTGFWSGAPITLVLTPGANTRVELHYRADLLDDRAATAVLDTFSALAAHGAETSVGEVWELVERLHVPELSTRELPGGLTSTAEDALQMSLQVLGSITGQLDVRPDSTWDEIGLTSLQAALAASVLASYADRPLGVARVIDAGSASGLAHLLRAAEAARR